MCFLIETYWGVRIDVYKRVKATKPDQTIIVMTGYDDVSIREKLREIARSFSAQTIKASDLDNIFETLNQCLNLFIHQEHSQKPMTYEALGGITRPQGPRDDCHGFKTSRRPVWEKDQEKVSNKRLSGWTHSKQMEVESRRVVGGLVG